MLRQETCYSHERPEEGTCHEEAVHDGLRGYGLAGVLEHSDSLQVSDHGHGDGLGLVANHSSRSGDGRDDEGDNHAEDVQHQGDDAFGLHGT